MNTPSPLVPQGTSPDRGKSNLFIKILVILMLHVVVIGGMLLQGCKDNKTNATNNPSDQTANNNADTNPPPPVVEAPPPLAPNTNLPPPAIGAPASSYATAPLPAPAPGTNPMVNNTAPAPMTAPMAAPTPAPAPAPVGGEYVVARGDTLAAIAKKNGVTLKALRAANPGVDPRKLKIGAKLQLPESANATAAAGPGAAPGAGTDTGEVAIYTVKAGDMLGRIAKAHGTTVAKIKALNDLKTTSIKVGQKLKLPGAKTPEPSTATSAPAPSTTTTTEAASSGMYAAAQPSGAMTH